jgi:hypothetical protein
MKSERTFIPGLVLFIILIPQVALSDIVVLNTGKNLKVEKSWEEGDLVWFIFHGMKASVPRKEVTHIKRDKNDQIESLYTKKNLKADLKTFKNDTANDVHRNQLNESTQISSSVKRIASPAKESCFLTNNGFRDLQWGVNVSSVDGLEQLETDMDLENVIEYVRPKEILYIGNIALTSIIYAFWRDQLYMVTIWTQDYSNFSALREMVFKQFGKGRRSDQSHERYLWAETPTDMMLEYIKDSRKGFLWQRSHELDRKYKLSRLNGHTSYLKWMNSRKQPATR